MKDLEKFVSQIILQNLCSFLIDDVLYTKVNCYGHRFVWFSWMIDPSAKSSTKVLSAKILINDSRMKHIYLKVFQLYGSRFSVTTCKQYCLKFD